MDTLTKDEYWGKYGEEYDTNQELVVGKELLTIMGQKLQELQKLGKTLELGCGTGYFTQFLHPNTDNLVATDFSPDLLEIATNRFGNIGSVSTQRENCMDVTFEDGEFDTVVMANVIHVISSPDKAIEEIYRVLKSSGRLILLSFTNDGMSLLETIKMGYRFKKSWGRPPKEAKSLSLEKLQKLLEKHGFDIAEATLLGRTTKAVYLDAVRK